MEPATTDELTSIIARLKNSPIYNLSLTSKELFHSNFLAWLCQTYPNPMAELFKPFLPVSSEGKVGAITRADRELNNIDLTLTFDNGYRLIIENKVKSLPYREQLKEYSNKVPDKTKVGFLLLSLTEPDFLDQATRTVKDDAYWQFLNYRELAEKLRTLLAGIPDNYHVQLLEDYVNFISDLDRIQKLFQFSKNDNSSDFFGNQKEIEKLGDIRLGDFVQKLRYAQLASYVAERLKEQQKQQGLEVLRGNWWDGNAGQFCVTSDMTRGVGLFDLKYIVRDIKEGKALAMVGIQIQGRAFRLVFEYSDKGKAMTIAEKLLQADPDATRPWFDFSLLPEPVLEYPRKGNFNQYNGTFLYRSKNLGATSPTKLIQIILEYAQLMRSRRSLIAEEIDKQERF